MGKMACTDCDWMGSDKDHLLADNPFDPTDHIVGCPQCKSVNTMVELCDEPDCHRISSCGFPTDDGGYRRTCFDHSKFKQDKDKEKP